MTSPDLIERLRSAKEIGASALLSCIAEQQASDKEFDEFCAAINEAIDSLAAYAALCVDYEALQKEHEELLSRVDRQTRSAHGDLPRRPTR